jgi:hypothetical protein
MGDFNTTLYPPKKKGGLENFLERMYDLAGFVGQNDLIDIELIGPPFTWSNNRLGQNLIQVRLDHALISTGWDIFQNSSLQAFPRTISKHSMLLLSWKQNYTSRRGPFRYEII